MQVASIHFFNNLALECLHRGRRWSHSRSSSISRHWSGFLSRNGLRLTSEPGVTRSQSGLRATSPCRQDVSRRAGRFLSRVSSAAGHGSGQGSGRRRRRLAARPVQSPVRDVIAAAGARLAPLRVHTCPVCASAEGQGRGPLPSGADLADLSDVSGRLVTSAVAHRRRRHGDHPSPQPLSSPPGVFSALSIFITLSLIRLSPQAPQSFWPKHMSLLQHSHFPILSASRSVHHFVGPPRKTKGEAVSDYCRGALRCSAAPNRTL